MRVFGLREEIGSPLGSSHTDEEKKQTAHNLIPAGIIIPIIMITVIFIIVIISNIIIITIIIISVFFSLFYILNNCMEYLAIMKRQLKGERH